MPQGAEAHDELEILRSEYIQKAMVSLLSVILNMMLAKYVKGIKLVKKDSEEERDFVLSIFQLLTLHWTLCMVLNFLLAMDPHLRRRWSRNCVNFIVGGIVGVNVVILI